MSSASKNQKKRQAKRKQKLKEEGGTVEEIKRVDEDIHKDPSLLLKEKLAEAKANGDHKLAAKLRQDLWVLQDMSHGHKPTGIDNDDVEKSLNRISEATQPPPSKTSPSQASGETGGVDKDVVKLQRKLRQIEALKERKNKGEKLESSQLSKIETEDEVREELRELHELLSSAKISR